MAESKKPSKKNLSKKERAVKKHTRKILGELPPFAGLNTKIEPSKRITKKKGPKLKVTYEVTDHKALEKDLEIKKKFAAMFNIPTMESYLLSNDPSDAIRQFRKAYLELLSEMTRLTHGKEISLESDQARAFIDGLEQSKSDRIDHAKFTFLSSILLSAKLPLDPRDEIGLMVEAFEEVKKSLPKRKSGPKEDKLIAEAWRKIDREGMAAREAYRQYMNKLGFQEFLYDNDYKAFREKIRGKRYEEKRKHAKKTVIAKTKQRRQNSHS